MIWDGIFQIMVMLYNGHNKIVLEKMNSTIIKVRIIFLYGIKRSKLEKVYHSINMNSKLLEIWNGFWVVNSSIMVKEMRYEIYVISTNVLQKCIF